VEDSFKLSVLPAAYYVSKAVVSTFQEVPVFLVGDAAMGLPLEKGLNYGWNISSQLVKFLWFSSSFKEAQIAYEAYFKKRAGMAISHVQKDYESYVATVRTAGFVRAIVKAIIMEEIKSLNYIHLHFNCEFQENVRSTTR